MTLFTGAVTFIILWWLVFFMTLPFGVKPPHEVGETAGPGHSEGAPVKPRLWLKVGITTAIAVLLWFVAFYLISSGMLSFRRP
jgi:predicted secreted protein